PVMELIEVRRSVRFEQALFGRLEERVAGTCPPHIASRITRFRLDLREELAGGFLRHRYLDARGSFEADRHALAPRSVGRAAVHRQRALGTRAGRDDE